MRRTLAVHYSFKEAAEKYVEYLQYPDKELPSLQELFPTNLQDTVSFHQQLCEAMSRNGYPFKGIKVISPSHAAARVLRAQQPLCTPLFDSFFVGDIISARQYKLQYVEGGICFATGGGLSGSDEASCSGFSPALEMTGTRFPFYPPTLPGFLCDLCSTVSIATGPANPLTKESAHALPSYGMVLTKDGEPVEVGSGKGFLDDPLKAVPLAKAYAKSIGVTLGESHVVLCSGLTPRVPSQLGSYTLQWGVFGSVQCTIV